MPGKTYQLFLKGLRNETSVIHIDEDASIARLLEMVKEKSGITDGDIRVLYTTKDLRAKDPHGKALYLSDYDIKDLGNLTIVVRVRGGSDAVDASQVHVDYEESEDSADELDEWGLESDYTDHSEDTGVTDGQEDTPVVQPKTYGPDVELTDLPDMFTRDDTEGGQRALMPCKHAIGPESLTAYCRSLLGAGKYEFHCPYKASPDDPFCGYLWDFFVVKKLAVLTQEEIKEFEIKISENYLRKAVGIQQCPGCSSYCERENKKNRRVVCPVCSSDKRVAFDFCWYCLKPWLTCGTTDCGNASCSGKDPRLKILRTCSTKTVIGVPMCPEVRACPTCGLLIQHKSACKQMECPCGQKFCFICLKMADANGRYQCGIWNTKCEIAPRQTTIPGD